MPLEVSRLSSKAIIHTETHTRTLLWALQNAGGDRYAVLQTLLAISHILIDDITPLRVRGFHNFVYAEQEKRASDKEYMEFCQKLQASRAIGLFKFDQDEDEVNYEEELEDF